MATASIALYSVSKAEISIVANLYNGSQIKAMFAGAVRWLEVNRDAINSLNVYPVPDGDTGTNMLLTMRDAMKEADQRPDEGVDRVMDAMGWGALMGSRGNSGLILSQILRGMARALEGKSTIGGSDLAFALGEASVAAYKGVSKPVEGTILTVIREAAQAARVAAQRDPCLDSVLEATVTAAQESVDRTPSLLPILREAGVVDAGGQGLLVILEGALKTLRNEPFPPPPQIKGGDAIARVSRFMEGEEEHVYGYCTMFLIQGERLDAAQIKEKIDAMGNSTVVVGDDALVRVHTHSSEPQAVVGLAGTLGQVSRIDIQDIDEQHREILHSAGPEERQPIAVVAVAAGRGIQGVFSDLGVSRLVTGGQTMNPSTQEVLAAVESAPSSVVVILPNNKNIVPGARQAASLSKKRVEVIPTTSIPQGIACMMAFNAASDIEDNIESMTEAICKVKTLELTRAVRPARVNGVRVKKGQAIGLLDGELLASGARHSTVVKALAPRLRPWGYSLATVYCGLDAVPSDKEDVLDSLAACLPSIEIDVLEGGQPNYDFIISLE